MRAPHAELLPVVGGQPAQREPVEEGAAGEQHDQQHAEHEAGDRVAEQHEQRGHRVEARALAHRLGHAERDRHEVADQEGPHPERDRDRQLLLDQLPDVLVLHEAAAEVEARERAEHLEVAHVRGLVEAVELLQLLDPLLVEVAAGLVATLDRAGPRLGHDLLDRAAGHELHDDERDGQRPDQRRDHQQHAPQDIGEHQRFLSSDLSHQHHSGHGPNSAMPVK